MQRASKWNTHSPYLHLETLRVQKLLSGNSYYKTQTVNNSTRKPSWVTQALRSPVERILCHFLRDPGLMNVTVQ